ncbi:hypothetical protein [Streptomyces griseoruber]|uniref:hypothetical protein n=1 Tax=Streptomyces griseoruber TaxID=1943 RepID=UPI0012FF0559|nr:hypothetical protein [Streptomyces griseoruber]
MALTVSSAQSAIRGRREAGFVQNPPHLLPARRDHPLRLLPCPRHLQDVPDLRRFAFVEVGPSQQQVKPIPLDRARALQSRGRQNRPLADQAHAVTGLGGSRFLRTVTVKEGLPPNDLPPAGRLSDVGGERDLDLLREAIFEAELHRGTNVITGIIAPHAKKTGRRMDPPGPGAARRPQGPLEVLTRMER